MASSNPELLAELIVLLLYALVATVLTAAGVAVEYTSVQYLSSGEAAVGVWLAAIGAVMLYAGVYGIGYQKVLPELLARR